MIDTFSENFGIKAQNYSDESNILMIPPRSIKIILQKSINLFKLICNNIDINEDYNFEMVKMVIVCCNRSVTKHDTVNWDIVKKHDLKLNLFSNNIPINNPLGFKIHTQRKRCFEYLKSMIDVGLDLNKTFRESQPPRGIRRIYDLMNENTKIIIMEYITFKKTTIAKQKLAFSKSLHERLGEQSNAENLDEIELFDRILQFL